MDRKPKSTTFAVLGRLRLACVVLLCVALVIPSSAQIQAASQVATVRKGTILQFVTTQSLTSATAKKGDPVELRLVRPLIVDGVTLLGSGELVKASVSKVRRAGSRCHYGEIRIKLQKIIFADGSAADTKLLKTVATPQAYASSKGVDYFFDALEVVIVAPLLSNPFTFLAGLMGAITMITDRPPKCSTRGTEFAMPAGTIIGVKIRKDHDVHY